MIIKPFKEVPGQSGSRHIVDLQVSISREQWSLLTAEVPGVLLNYTRVEELIPILIPSFSKSDVEKIFAACVAYRMAR